MRSDSDGSRRTERAARQVILLSTSAASALSDRLLHELGEEVIAIMDTQITSRGGLISNVWVQVGALAILAVVVIALAAKYVW